MTTMITEIYEAFRSVGIEESKATAAAKAIPSREHLPTKEDLFQVQINLKDEIQSFRTEVKDEINSFRTEVKDEIGRVETKLNHEISNVRQDMLNMELRLTVRFGGMMAVGIIIGVLKYL